jgi:NAD(P)-dependent dehydrogenase (short-subunit alcohol dehydrogenase family)
MGQMDGKVAIVTGSGRGIGAAGELVAARGAADQVVPAAASGRADAGVPVLDVAAAIAGRTLDRPLVAADAIGDTRLRAVGVAAAPVALRVSGGTA